MDNETREYFEQLLEKSDAELGWWVRADITKMLEQYEGMPKWDRHARFPMDHCEPCVDRAISYLSLVNQLLDTVEFRDVNGDVGLTAAHELEQAQEFISKCQEALP